jgi:uncharacterized repeat protein (TIGR04138 family)
MQPVQFHQAIEVIRRHDPRFDPSAYFFLKEALDFTLKKAQEQAAPGSSPHVTGAQLLTGFRELALQDFGPMAATLFKEWGVRNCTHVGDLVFHLIDAGIFGKQDSDTREDFREVFDFEDVFVKPFLPKRERTRPSGTRSDRPRLRKEA